MEMRFTKYNNPNRRKKNSIKYSRSYIEEQRDEMYKLLSQAETQEQRDNIIKAFNVSIRG